jgi:hypothetical protein
VIGGITVVPDARDSNTNTGNGKVTISYAAPTGPIVSGYRGTKCVEDSGDSTANDSKIVMAGCDGSAGQRWTVEADKTIRINGKCMDIYRDQKTSKALVELWTPAPATPTSNGTRRMASW